MVYAAAVHVAEQGLHVDYAVEPDYAAVHVAELDLHEEDYAVVHAVEPDHVMVAELDSHEVGWDGVVVRAVLDER